MKRFLAVLAVLSSVFSIAQDNSEIRQSVDPALFPFYHGVASGDPLSDRVILWTKISPEENLGQNIEVSYRVATDTGMHNIVKEGSFVTNSARDYTVKVDVKGLQPYTYYYYDFKALGRHSVRGRTKTAPSGDQTDEIRLGVVACSNYEYGYFNAYKMLTKRNDVDAIVHLGDYIYEYEVGGYSANIEGRNHEPENEIISLQDYRIRHSHYKLDNDLKDLHQQYPFIAVWDDHESADNSYKDGANNHTEGTEGTWVDRKAASIKAYMEWMPIRETNGISIYRTIKYGDLMNLYMIDTRIEGRDEQAQTGNIVEISDSTRRLIGDTQFEWLVNEMKNSSAKWNVLGQQVMMAPLRAGIVPINTDQWDGYEFERNRLYQAIKNNNISNFVVLTGDIHSSWANDLPETLVYEPLTGTGSVGVEFICTSVTSPGLDIPMGNTAIKAGNPHIQYLDLTQKGYLVLHLSPEFAQGEWYYQVVNEPVENETFGAAYRVSEGQKHLVQENTPVSSMHPKATPAPEHPTDYVTGIKDNKNLLVFGVHPNPFADEFQLQFYSVNGGGASVKLIDQQGKVVLNKIFDRFSVGVNYMKVNCYGLATGSYVLQVEENGHVVAKKLLKK